MWIPSRPTFRLRLPSRDASWPPSRARATGCDIDSPPAPSPGRLRLTAPRGSRVVLAACALAAFALAACGGGGGPSGGDGDTTPPPAPNLALINATIPQGGSSVVTGAGGAVESGATVRVVNVDATQRTGGTVQATTQASQSGTFAVTIQAVIGDRLAISAIDAAGNESPSVETTAGPAISSIQLRVVSGDQQFGVAGRTLPDTFRIQAAVGQTLTVVAGLAILFESETPGGVFSQTRVITNNDGNAGSAYTLSSTEGPHTLVAKLEASPTNQVRGTARAVGPPQVTAVTPSTMVPGDTVTVSGANFSPISAHNVVMIGLERGSVVTATTSSLRVVVPPFATQGPVTVTLTGVTSNGFDVTVQPAVIAGRPLGDVQIQTLPTSGDGQIILPFEDATQEFTLVLESLSASSTLAAVRVSGSSGAVLRAGLAPAGLAESPVSGESFIREMERELLGRLPRGAAAPLALRPADALQPAQELGSTRQFWVVNKPTAISLTDPANFDRVTATLRFIGDHALIYVDNRAANTVSDVEINQVGNRFDDLTYQTDVDAFGLPSDIDGDGKLIILLSPTVNFLTTPEIMAQGARIIGFFFGIDLIGGTGPDGEPVPLPNNPHANLTEIFYAVVPNENNEFTGARVTRAEIVNLLGGVFAHEFLHMISFNQHLLVRNGQPEALWLDEGLAHLAESLNGFHTQNRLRSAFFLDSPSDVTLVAGGDGLDERGAAWLFVQYLVDRFGQAILGRLVQTNLTSTANVTAAAGNIPFPTLFHEWASTLLLDGPGIPNAPIFEMTSVDLRGDFEISKQQISELGPVYLAIRSLFAPGNTANLQQRGTSPLYVAVTSRGRANVPVTIDGTTGALLQVSVIRTK